MPVRFSWWKDAREQAAQPRPADWIPKAGETIYALLPVKTFFKRKPSPEWVRASVVRCVGQWLTVTRFGWRARQRPRIIIPLDDARPLGKRR